MKKRVLFVVLFLSFVFVVLVRASEKEVPLYKAKRSESGDALYIIHAKTGKIQCVLRGDSGTVCSGSWDPEPDEEHFVSKADCCENGDAE